MHRNSSQRTVEAEDFRYGVISPDRIMSRETFNVPAYATPNGVSGSEYFEPCAENLPPPLANEVLAGCGQVIWRAVAFERLPGERIGKWARGIGGLEEKRGERSSVVHIGSSGLMPHMLLCIGSEL
jgi:hypothetical protein